MRITITTRYVDNKGYLILQKEKGDQDSFYSKKLQGIQPLNIKFKKETGFHLFI
jgi:hypothetical protein